DGALFAQALGYPGPCGEGLPLFRRNLESSLKPFGSEHRFSRTTANNLGDSLVRAGHFGDALALLEPVVELDRRVAPPSSLAIALTTLGGAEQGAGRLPSARDHLREAVALMEKQSMGGATLLEALEHLGQVQLALHEDGARATLERAVALGESAKLSPLLVAPSRFALARALPAGELARARTLATEARAAMTDEKRRREID